MVACLFIQYFVQYLLKLSNFICDLKLFNKTDLKADLNYKIYLNECPFAQLQFSCRTSVRVELQSSHPETIPYCYKSDSS